MVLSYEFSKKFDKYLSEFECFDESFLKEIKFNLDLQDLSQSNVQKVIDFAFKYISKNKEIDDRFYLTFSIYFKNVFYKLFGEQFDMKSKIIEKNEHPSVGHYAVFNDKVYVQINGEIGHYLLITYLPGELVSLYSKTHDSYLKGVFSRKSRYETFVKELNYYLWEVVKIEE